MVDVDVLLHSFAKLIAVDSGHHDVGDYDVGGVGREDSLQGVVAVVVGRDLVVATEFGGQEVADVGIVFNNGHGLLRARLLLGIGLRLRGKFGEE